LDSNEAIELYKKIIDAVTDEKINIRKEAIIANLKLTMIFTKAFHVGRDDNWQKILYLNNAFNTLKNDLKN